MVDKNSFIYSFDSFNGAYRCLWFTFHTASVPMTLDTNCGVSRFFFSSLFSFQASNSFPKHQKMYGMERHLNPMSKPTNRSKKPQKKKQHEQRQGERSNKQKIIQEKKEKKSTHIEWRVIAVQILRRVQCTQQRC